MRKYKQSSLQTSEMNMLEHENMNLKISIIAKETEEEKKQRLERIKNFASKQVLDNARVIDSILRTQLFTLLANVSNWEETSYKIVEYSLYMHFTGISNFERAVSTALNVLVSES